MAEQRDFEQTLPVGFKLVGGLHEYIIEQVLGQGGFGITYKVKTQIISGNISIDANFAIKEFFPSGCWRNPGSAEMLFAPTSRDEVKAYLKDFITEGKRLQQLCRLSPNIVNVNEVFEANGTAYFVMEYLNGGDIRKLAHKNGGRLGEADALNILTPIAKAVDTLHHNHMLHLDIKPENIVMRQNSLDSSEIPVLIDFGIAVHFSDDGSPTTTRPSKGVTKGYSPVEQFAGITHFDPRIDVYALSATCYYMLTGKDPRSAFDITTNEISNSLEGHATKRTINALLHGMQKELAHRTISARELLAELLPKEELVQDIVDKTIATDYTSNYDTAILDNNKTKVKDESKQKNRKPWIIVATIAAVAFLGFAIWGIVTLSSDGKNDTIDTITPPKPAPILTPEQEQWNHGLAIGAQWIALDLCCGIQESDVIQKFGENYTLDDLRNLYGSKSKWVEYYNKLKAHENESGDVDKLLSTIMDVYNKPFLKAKIKSDLEK